MKKQVKKLIIIHTFSNNYYVYFKNFTSLYPLFITSIKLHIYVIDMYK